MQPQIIGYEPGINNANRDATLRRLSGEGAYKDQSTVCIIPALQMVNTKAAASWWNLITPPNQRFYKLFAQGMEVGEAYSQTIEMVLNTPELAKSKFLLTMEADNVVPPDGLLNLIKRMDAHPEFACIGGLYYTKGGRMDGTGWVGSGQPQIWGDPKDSVVNFRPQMPVPGQLVECVGTGMGFNLWRMSMFKDKNLRRPWFKTLAGKEGVGTQDLYAWADFRKHGYRCAVDCSVLVGHVDSEGFVW